MSSDIHSRRWWILGILGVAQLMVVLDATIVNIALPSAQHSLGFSNDARQWVVTTYALAFGSLLLLGGRLGDLFGRHVTLLTGLIGFAVASAIGGLAPNFTVLIMARGLQGAFGALLAPAALGVLTTTFSDPEERGKAFGLYGAIAGGGGAVGLLLGGLLTQYLSWRFCLYVNLVLAVPATFGALAIVPRETGVRGGGLDLPGVTSAFAGLFSVVFGFSEAETHSWGSPLVWGFLAAGVLLIALFIVIELRVKKPLLPMRVVLDRNRGGALLAMGLSAVGMFGVFLFLTYYLQETLGFSPVKTGLAFLPMVGVLVMVSGVTSTVLLPRVGPRPLIPTGLVLAAVGMVLMSHLTVASTYAGNVLPSVLVMGAGLGLVMAPGMNTATDGVDREHAGVASAMTNTVQQIGGSIGTAVLSTVAASALSSYVKSGHSPALAAVHSYTTAFTWSAAIFAVAAVLTAIVLRSGVTETDPDAVLALAH